jgi:hypothetical protein
MSSWPKSSAVAEARSAWRSRLAQPVLAQLHRLHVGDVQRRTAGRLDQCAASSVGGAPPGEHVGRDVLGLSRSCPARHRKLRVSLPSYQRVHRRPLASRKEMTTGFPRTRFGHNVVSGWTTRGSGFSKVKDVASWASRTSAAPHGWRRTRAAPRWSRECRAGPDSPRGHQRVTPPVPAAEPKAEATDTAATVQGDNHVEDKRVAGVGHGDQQAWRNPREHLGRLGPGEVTSGHPERGRRHEDRADHEPRRHRSVVDGEDVLHAPPAPSPAGGMPSIKSKNIAENG